MVTTYGLAPFPSYDQAPVPPPLQPGSRVERVTDGPLFEKAERIEYEVFRSLDYCEPSEELRSMEYEP